MPAGGEWGLAAMTKGELYELGRQLVRRFCAANGLPHIPIRNVPREDWHVNACAYYRPARHRDTGYATAGINICLPYCAAPATEYQVRNWNWPGATTDREPYGVLAHELGHHMDYTVGDDKWSYGSDYSKATRKASKEPAISGYCPNDAEWFAEMARIYVCN